MHSCLGRYDTVAKLFVVDVFVTFDWTKTVAAEKRHFQLHAVILLRETHFHLKCRRFPSYSRYGASTGDWRTKSSTTPLLKCTTNHAQKTVTSTVISIEPHRIHQKPELARQTLIHELNIISLYSFITLILPPHADPRPLLFKHQVSLL